MDSVTHAPRPIAAVIALAIAVAAWTTDGHATPGPADGGKADLCAGAVAAQEKRHGIPKRLLTAISLVESGRWDAEAGKGAAWPWTVTAEGKGRFFPTKAAAIAAVRELQNRGITSIDVGCMQVNLHYHPTAFASLDAAFDPAQNASYAARFLTDLKREQGSWQQAVQHYHSSTAAKRIPYQKKVYTAWREATAEDRKTGAAGIDGRMRRIGREIERDHRLRVTAYKRGQIPQSANQDSATADDTPRFLASWPPRSAQAQFRAQNLARAWAFGGSTRGVRP